MTATDRGTAPRPPKSAESPARSARTYVAVLLAAVVLVACSLALPWWSESESYGTETWQQSYSLLTGVTASCSPSCPSLDSGPPSGPLQGTQSFTAAGLNETGLLYRGVLALTVVGLIGAGVALVSGLIASRRTRSLGQPRGERLALGFALILLAIALAALPLFQPGALHSDVQNRFSPGNAWTPSPSPEISFWGSCSLGSAVGVCLSGGSAAWGPGPGWYVAAIGLVLIATALILRSGLRVRSAPARP